ncbi:HNH endonuclease [Candidatus Gracilibacteria bacterium]|nr:HNH endonuclease [Candidatus Gracilibacteria bacterium]
MKDQILLYREMCNTENAQTLQRGMNYRLNAEYSVILMSQRSNSPYNDQIYNDGVTIEYEGHDLPKTSHKLNPKDYDQPDKTKNGKPTQNGLFIQAVDGYKSNLRSAEIVRVYEKILPGIWSEKGFFKLIDYKKVYDGNRNVFRFILEETEIELTNNHIIENKLKPRSRIIPTDVKKVVWERDEGKCVICGETDELHFDHDLPYSKGGTSITADNIKILCARHNLSKSDKIEGKSQLTSHKRSRSLSYSLCSILLYTMPFIVLSFFVGFLPFDLDFLVRKF